MKCGSLLCAYHSFAMNFLSNRQSVPLVEVFGHKVISQLISNALSNSFDKLSSKGFVVYLNGK